MTEPFATKLDFAKFLAVEAGKLAQRLFQTKTTKFVETKGLQDFVTLADHEVEGLIRDLIAQHYPGDAVLGEEAGSTGSGNQIWVIDPIDGTANYMRGLSDWAISIAYCEGDEIIAGVIYAPDRNDLCWAKKSMGAYQNGHLIRVSSCTRSDQAMLLLGRSSRSPLQSYLAIVKRTINTGMEYPRRNGSAAISLMTVAQGSAEGYYEAHLNAWDAVAGILLIREAGGYVLHADLSDFLLKGSALLTYPTSALKDEMINATRWNAHSPCEEVSQSLTS